MAHQNRPIVYVNALVIVIFGVLIGWQLRKLVERGSSKGSGKGIKVDASK